MSAKKVAAEKQSSKKLLTIVILGFGGVSLFIICFVLSFTISPWPNALLYRYAFEKDAQATSKALEKYVPSDIDSVQNLQYRPNDPDAYLDVYYPSSVTNSDQVLPTVVWIHGGGWISGNKEQVANYLKILSSKGYTTVSINYSLAPEHQYPLPVVQVNDALAYLSQNATQLHIDSNKFVLAGDSGGAQIAAQEATVITNPEYVTGMNIVPGIRADQLQAVLLACGPYDVGLVNIDNAQYGNFLKTILWAYSGKKDFLADPEFQKLSIVNYVNQDFPAAFITVGNADPLEDQSVVLAGTLTQQGVLVDTLFFSEDHQPPLEHEYQFKLDTPDGQMALNRMVEFLERTVR